MSSCSVSVAVRLRPFNAREKSYKAQLCIGMDANQTIAKKKDGGDPKKFNFDYSFNTHTRDEAAGLGPFADQVYVYERIGQPLLENVLIGFNSCLFAYGQTGAGKSWSMMGSAEEPGVIPQLCGDLFRRAAAISDTTSVAVDVSFLEIYNEQVKDLLNPAGLDKVLKVRQHPKLGVFVEGLKKINARSADEIAKLLDDGTQVRTIASTQMNATSSRSHAILTLNVRVKTTQTETLAVLHLVDLAGSERQASTGAEGQTLKEGANINKSLSVLGMCLSRLADQASGTAGGHIPFRDSQLTWLLHDALGGNSKTTMLAAISPADINYEETLSTLRFASITKRIKMIVKVNEDPQTKIIRELREQIAQIKEEIKMLAEGKMVQRAPPPLQQQEEQQQPDDVFEPELDAMAVDALPGQSALDVRRAQLLQELEENTNLMTEWTMTDEQRAEKDEEERAAHERQMEALKKGSGGAGSSVVESCPKLLVLNEDLRVLRGTDGIPLPLVHTMLRPERAAGGSRAASEEGAGAADGRNRAGSLSASRSHGFGAAAEPPHVFTCVGPSAAAAASSSGEPEPRGAEPWIRLPTSSGLTDPAMRLHFVVDFAQHTMSLEFQDPNNKCSASGDIVFVNGKPIRLLGGASSSSSADGAATAAAAVSSSSPSSSCVTLVHNDRVIVGQVIFRVFEPLSWRAEAECGTEETFSVDPQGTEHVELLERFDRLLFEEWAFDELLKAMYGDDSDDSTADSFSSPPRSRAHSGGDDNNNQQQQQPQYAAASMLPGAVQVRAALDGFASFARFSRADLEEQLVQRFPRDVKRELRARDSQDALTFDANRALKERQDYIAERQAEQRRMADRVAAVAEEGERLRQQLEEQERLREAAARAAKEHADRAAQAQVQEAEARAKQMQEQAAKMAGGGGAGGGGPVAVAKMKQTAQSKLAVARKVHEYEELRRELLLWKPAGPTDPRDRPQYVGLVDAISTGKGVPTYINIRGMFAAAAPPDPSTANLSAAVAAATSAPDDLLLPRFEAQVFKNRIKTGFFSRGGLHPVTLLILAHFLFYFDPGAALTPPAAATQKMMGFAYLVGCEVEIMEDIEKKPAMRVISCAPRKTSQGKTDAHHPLEFAFVSVEQREAAVRAINAVRLPAPDPDVAAALAQLE